MRFIARHFHNGDMICTMHLCLSYWGSHFILLQREHERGRGWKWEKEILQNWMRHRGFWPCGIEKYSIFLPFIVGGRGYHFLLPQREEGRKEQGQKMRKGKSSKVNETQGFLYLGIQIGPFAACWAVFVQLNFQLFSFHTGESNSLLPQRERKEGRSRGRKWEKGTLQ